MHDLVRETIRDRLPPDERRALYAAIVRAADAAGLAIACLPAQLAWLADAGRARRSRRERAVALLGGGRRRDASPDVTHEAAGRHSRRPPRLTEDPDERARLTLESGHAYQRAGDLGRARERYASLLEADDAEIRARALLGLHRLGDPAAAGEPSDVVRQLDAIDGELRARQSTSRCGPRCWRPAAARAPTCWPTTDRTPRTMAAEALELARLGR